MKQIVGWAFVAVVIGLVSFTDSIAEDMVHWEGNDLVISREIERYKNLPKEIPVNDVLRIMRAGEGSYALPVKEISSTYTFKFPFLSKAAIFEDGTWKYSAYGDGQWRLSSINRHTFDSRDTVKSALLIWLPTASVFWISVVSRRRGIATRRLYVFYWTCLGMIGFASVCGSWFREGITSLISAVLIAVLGYFAGGVASFYAITSNANDIPKRGAGKVIVILTGLLAGLLGLVTMVLLSVIGAGQGLAFALDYFVYVGIVCLVASLISLLFRKGAVSEVPYYE